MKLKNAMELLLGLFLIIFLFFPFSMLLVIFVQTDILISGSDGHWKLKFSFCKAKFCFGYLLIFNVEF